MPPDLNSLPTSRSTSLAAVSPLADRPRRISFNNTETFRPSPPSPRSPSLSSLQAAATINAGLQRSPANASPGRSGMQRRRSSLLNNISINDPSLPAPGELQQSDSNSPRSGRRSFVSHDSIPPHHGRHLSLGELHQELENEQEAQVNRLLYMIRMQQDQLAALSRDQHHNDSTTSTSPTEQQHAFLHNGTSTSSGAVTEQFSPRGTPLSAQSSQIGAFPRPHSLSRQSSSRFSSGAGASSRGASPALRPVSATLGPLSEDFLLEGTRDECAFYQAETQMLTRENQMLKHRIRELERQISETSASSTQQVAAPLSPLASSPSTIAAAPILNGQSKD